LYEGNLAQTGVEPALSILLVALSCEREIAASLEAGSFYRGWAGLDLTFGERVEHGIADKLLHALAPEFAIGECFDPFFSNEATDCEERVDLCLKGRIVVRLFSRHPKDLAVALSAEERPLWPHGPVAELAMAWDAVVEHDAHG